MTYNFEHFYRCGEKRFHNIFQAFEEQKNTGQFPEYIIDDELVQSIKGVKRPKNLNRQYLQRLMIARLKELRKKYQRLVLYYSGGTDSYTIMRLCVENDIFIDETITHMISVKNNIRVDIEPYAGLLLAKKHEGTGIGKCSEFRPTEDHLSYIDDPEWFLKDNFMRGCNITNRFFSTPMALHDEINQHDSTVILTGFEKPRLYIENGQLHWTVLDVAVAELMGLKKVVPFFLDKENPELVVGMTYAMADMIDVKQFKSKGQMIEINADRKAKLKTLEPIGLYKTPYHWINTAILGKDKMNYNIKTKRAFKELQKIGRNDYIGKIWATHKRIIERYGKLPHALQTQGNISQTVARLCEKVPILQEKFGG